MVPPGPPAPFEGSQAVPTPTFLRSNSGLLGGSGSGMSSQGAFPSMVSPRNQLSNMNMLGNMPNVSSLLQQSLANNAGPGIAQQQRVVMDNGAESDPLSVNVPNASFVSSTQNAKPNATTTFQGHQFSSPNMNLMLADLQQTNSQTDPNYFQHYQQSMNQFTASSNNQGQQQSMRAGLGGVGLIKLEPQMINDQSQQLQANNTIQSPGAVKLETQQLPSMRTLPPVKMEPQNSDSPMFSPHQQQQQQLLNASRLSPQAAAAAQILHQQRLAQIQQQQLTKTIPQQQQRGGPVQQQQQFQAQNLPTRSPVKPIYEPGMCARRLTHYMYQQQHRPEDNNIEYWKKFVAEYFAPNAKKKWCVSMYGSGRQTTGVFPQDIWNCEICLRKPGRGFEATVEVLPRLFKLKYESGTLEELLYVDMPREYQNSSGQIVLDYAKAIQESVFEQLRVVRDGQLRIVFSQDLKICSWEFCARRHEELIPKRLLIPQVNQLGSAAQKYQAAVQSAPTNISVPDMQNNCNMFIASARQLAKTMEVPLVNDLGYSKRYVRCLQISEVVNSMKDLIDFSRDSGIGPMESLTKFPRRTGSFSGFNNGPPNKQNEEQQQQHNGDDCVQGNSLNPSPSPATSAGNLLLHQNSMNSRQQQNPMNNNSVTGGGSYLGSSSQLPSPSSSSTTLPQQTQTTIPSPIQSPLPSSSNNPQQVVGNSSNNNSDAVIDSQSSVQKIIQGMMMTSSQLGGGGGGGMMSLNGLLPPPMTNNGLVVGNGFGGGGGSSLGFGNNGVNGIRAALRNNSSLNGRIGMTIPPPPPPREQSLNQQQHDMVGNQTAINGLGSVNGFNNHQFDWKASSP